MTTWSDRLALIVTADTKGAVAGLEAVGTTAERELTKAQSKLDATGRNLTRLGVGSIAAGAVIGAGLYKAAQAYDEANKASLQLENTIRNQPALAGANAKALEGLAQSIQHKTAADGDEIVAGMAKLGMYGANEAALRQLTPLVVDYARKTGKDMVSAFADVGKALNGQQRALKAAGVAIDANAYETDRLSAITDGLRQSVGGFAEREGKTFSGQMQRLKNDAMDLAEGLGKGVADALGDLTGAVDKATRGFGALGEGGQATIGRFATYGAGVLVLSGAVSVTAGQVIKFRDQIKAIPGLLDKLATSAYSGAGKVDSLAAAMRGMSPSLAVGVSAAAASILAFSIDTSKAAKSAKELRTEAEAGGKTLKETLARGLAEVAAGDKAQKFLDNAKLSVADLVAAVAGGDDALNAFIGKITRSYGEANSANVMGLEDFQLSLYKQAQEYRKAVRSQKAYEEGIRALGPTLDKATASTKELAKAQEESLSAEFAYGQASADVADAQRDVADAHVEAARRVADADRAITDAQRDVRDAHQDVVDSYRALDDAAKSYQDRVAGLQDTIEGGQISQERAQIAVAKAQQAYDAALATNDPVQIRDADLDLRDAKLQLKRANDNLTDAQSELNDANATGLANSPEMVDAEKRVKEAKDREKDATDKLVEAENDRQTAVKESAKAIEEANGKVLDAIRKQQEQVLILIAAWRILHDEQAKNPTSPPVSIIGGQHSPPVNGPNAPTGGRSAVGPKSVTNINVYVDGSKTRDAAIEAGTRKAQKQAILAYNRRAA